MMLHPVLFRTIAGILRQIFFENLYADKVIERAFKSNPKLGSRDRAFIAEHCYDIVRYIRLYQYCLDGNETFAIGNQLHFERLIAVHFYLKDLPLPQSSEFSIDAKAVDRHREQALHIGRINESIPDWLDETGREELGDQW